MNDAPTDSMFKLRLPGQLREKLEREAQAKGKTLTSEILERLEDTFSTNPDRIAALEKVVFDERLGNERLRENLSLLDLDVVKIFEAVRTLEIIATGFTVTSRHKK